MCYVWVDLHTAGLAMLFAYLAQRFVPPTPCTSSLFLWWMLLRWLLVIVARVIAEMVVAFVSLTALSLLWVLLAPHLTILNYSILTLASSHTTEVALMDAS